VADEEVLERYVGFDLGDARIGVAVSDLLGITAQPGGVFKRKGKLQDQVLEITLKAEATKIVLGLPKHMSGEEGERAKQARKLAENIKKDHGIEVHLWDERSTTVQAEAELLRAGLRRDKRKALRDQVAAQIILQAFLDARAKA